METPWIVVLVLLGLWALTSGILGVVVFVRGRRIQALVEENCKLVQEAGRAERVVRQVINGARIDRMVGNEMAAEFNRLFADIDGGTGGA